uniref:Cell death abnormality protein 1-like n=1 Tax=Crassostrea virginica TaxID=6565 RepID=A0A8B8ANP5_CRAVI|nr:cell death abnormality protein 1-like [Crassostrea virginica]
MDTVLLITSIMLLMVHSSDLVLNESLGATYPSCLPDYRWSTKFGKCVECLPGFYGSDCSETCRYPNYGYGCQQKCHCSEIICNSAKGCRSRELGMYMDKIDSRPTYCWDVLWFF